MSSTTTVRHVLAKLEKSIQDGDYYHAHQMFKTLYARYMAKKKLDDVKELLTKGAGMMLDKGQLLEGTDLALNLIDHFTKNKIPPSPETIQIVKDLFSKYPAAPHPGKKQFVRAAVKWSKSKEQNNNYGDPELHALFAKSFWAQKEYETAQAHFLRSNDIGNLAQMLKEWIAAGYPSETDLFICRPVFLALCLKDLKNANDVFRKMRALFPQLDTPLMNFVNFLLQLVQKEAGAAPVFNVLKQKYSVSLSRDPMFAQALEQIGLIYFNIQKPSAGGMGGMISQMLKGFLGDGGDADQGSGESLDSMLALPAFSPEDVE